MANLCANVAQMEVVPPGAATPSNLRDVRFGSPIMRGDLNTAARKVPRRARPNHGEGRREDVLADSEWEEVSIAKRAYSVPANATQLRDSWHSAVRAAALQVTCVSSQESRNLIEYGKTSTN
eukprot:6002680-Amphidinium_carterae.1